MSTHVHCADFGAMRWLCMQPHGIAWHGISHGMAWHGVHAKAYTCVEYSQSRAGPTAHWGAHGEVICRSSGG